MAYPTRIYPYLPEYLRVILVLGRITILEYSGSGGFSRDKPSDLIQCGDVMAVPLIFSY